MAHIEGADPLVDFLATVAIWIIFLGGYLLALVAWAKRDERYGCLRQEMHQWRDEANRLIGYVDGIKRQWGQGLAVYECDVARVTIDLHQVDGLLDDLGQIDYSMCRIEVPEPFRRAFEP